MTELVDIVGSSARWRAETPSPTCVARILGECGRDASEVACAGDRVKRLRRGPWGPLQAGAERAHIRIDSLAALPAALAVAA